MKLSMIRMSLVAFIAVVVCHAGADSSPSSVAIPQEVSEIRTKPSDPLRTEEGVKQLTQLQKQYRENLSAKRPALARGGKKVVRRKGVQLAE